MVFSIACPIMCFQSASLYFISFILLFYFLLFCLSVGILLWPTQILQQLQDVRSFFNFNFILIFF